MAGFILRENEAKVRYGAHSCLAAMNTGSRPMSSGQARAGIFCASRAGRRPERCLASVWLPTEAIAPVQRSLPIGAPGSDSVR